MMMMMVLGTGVNLYLRLSTVSAFGPQNRWRTALLYKLYFTREWQQMSRHVFRQVGEVCCAITCYFCRAIPAERGCILYFIITAALCVLINGCMDG